MVRTPSSCMIAVRSGAISTSATAPSGTIRPSAVTSGRLLEARQLQPAQPDDQLGAGAAEQLLDAFVQELLDVEGEAGHAAGLLPERLGHRLRIDVGCELHHHLAALGAPDVLREGRAA